MEGPSLKHIMPYFIGESEAMQILFEHIERVACTGATVLIEGESGTGKELIAESIHKLSDRADKPFVRFNCAALSESLVESELFGHIEGAFTGASTDRKGRFELANTGTIFIDEIGELSLNMQVKLLRVLQEKVIERVGSSEIIKTDIRIIAATNKSLHKMVKNNEFRDDLYYRLNTFPVLVPPLRVRENDILLLSKYYLEQYNKEYKRNVLAISEEAKILLLEHKWPGNVRELQNVISRAVIMSLGTELNDMDITFNVYNRQDEDGIINTSHPIVTEDELVSHYAKYVLQKMGGNKKRTAEVLGINYRTLMTRLTIS